MGIIPGCDIICRLCDVRIRVLKDNYLYLLRCCHFAPEGTLAPSKPYVCSKLISSLHFRVFVHLELFSVLNSHMI
jgi:hypothetical protein